MSRTAFYRVRTGTGSHRRAWPILILIFLSGSIAFLLLACASLGLSLASGPNSEPLEPPWQTAENIENILPEWKPFREGVELTSFSILQPPLQFWATRIDLHHPALKLIVGPNEIQAGRGRSIKTTTFARQSQSLIAVNANPFDPSSDLEGEPRRIAGIVVSEGNLLSPPHPKYAALGIFSDGNAATEAKVLDVKAAILEQSRIVLRRTEAWYHNSILQYAVGGFFIVLREGVVQDSLKRRNDRHARTAAGIAKEGSTLFLLVIDGYRQSSIGATEQETGKILQRLGATDGLILDGGGSSTFVLRTSDGQYRALNVPMHRRIPHRERAVGVCLGVRFIP